MKGYKSFAVTVLGGSHIKNGLDCQDASDHYNDDDSNVYIAVVADGHGDSVYFRSDIGAKFAVECAIEGIKLFAKETAKFFDVENSNNDSTTEHPSKDEFDKSIREKLIKQMVFSWNIKVEDHQNKNPFKPEELENVREKYRLKFEKGESINKAYGTTLIAAVITPWYWFAFHVGDGRFSVLYPDGNGDQPVLWDERCFLNSTTSICDDDVLEREQLNPKTGKMEPVGIRCYLSFINEGNPPPIAFFLCTDGIDDNYPVGNNEIHLYRLYRTIAVGFAEKGYESNCGEDGKSGSLERLAKRFATEGKGDDTSIAGIVNIEELRKVAPEWKNNMEKAEAERTEAKRIAEENAAKKAKEEDLWTALKAAKNAADKAAAEVENVNQSLVKVNKINEASLKKLFESTTAVLTNANNHADTARSAAEKAEKIVLKIFNTDENSANIQDAVRRTKDEVEIVIKSVRDAHNKLHTTIADIFNTRKTATKKTPPITETTNTDIKTGTEKAGGGNAVSETTPASSAKKTHAESGDASVVEKPTVKELLTTVEQEKEEVQTAAAPEAEKPNTTAQAAAAEAYQKPMNFANNKDLSGGKFEYYSSGQHIDESK